MKNGGKIAPVAPFSAAKQIYKVSARYFPPQSTKSRNIAPFTL